MRQTPGPAKGFQPFPAGDKKEPSFPQKDIFVDCLFSGDATKASTATKGASTLMNGGFCSENVTQKKFQDPLKLKRCKKFNFFILLVKLLFAWFRKNSS